MTESRTSLDVRSSIVETFRGDLVGPAPQDLDLARERLNENPSRWSHRLFSSRRRASAKRAK